jgi:hypothetical protein
MSKMGLHDPFGHLKHKLWLKEKSKVKLTFWLPTTKSQESTRLPHVQVACDILLKSSRQGLQLCFTSQSKVCTQSYRAPKSRESQFWDSHLGVPRQNAICMWALWRGTKYTIRGEGGGFPQVRAMVSLVSPNLSMVCSRTKNVLAMH